ncbi:hypothetical protein WJX73_008964 [Symbiochloris irregularis]|uniref:BPL/LPL catalytic domain-containing protein n=1 Tax=Symbiochloris irregularis TaxID=706552 RepID=A0AAW1PNA9_9CHLO
MHCFATGPYDRLCLEEALLRTTSGNWCFVNDGAAEPAIVLGISGKPHELIEVEKAKAARIQVIKRFSGGGTVVVDGNTQFVTLVVEGSSLPQVEVYPRPVMKWSESFYAPLFSIYGDFHLREHDYIFGEHKFGGNAQAITKQRWLHHTSFLWDFDPERMELLQAPARAPQYRAGRSHLDFICCLKNKLPDRSSLPTFVEKALSVAGFKVEACSLAQAEELLQQDYLRTTREIQL